MCIYSVQAAISKHFPIHMYRANAGPLFSHLNLQKRSRYSNRAVITLYSNRTVMVIVRANRVFGIQYQYSYYTG